MQIPEPRLRHVTCASATSLHRMAYWEWGPQQGTSNRFGAPPLGTIVCVHGLTRNGRDFDALAARLSSRWRVVCPDIVGRGRSDRLADPRQYVVPQYVADCVTLIARLDVERVTWIGTSMGGLIGMVLAALPGSPIERLVLNDIGPLLDVEGLARIGSYVGQDPSFASREQALAALRELMRSFGPHTDEQFELLARNFLVQRGDRWGYNYDPNIAVPFRETTGGTPGDLWPFYDAIKCPTLLLRGAESDLLSEATARQMTERGPCAELVEFAGVGHAPTLIAPEQIEAIERFLPQEHA